MPGHDLERHAGARCTPRPPRRRARTRTGSPPFSRTTVAGRRGRASTSSVVDLLLRHRDAARAPCRRRRARRAAARARAARATRAGRRRRRRRARSSSSPRHGEQPGIARARADEIHGHATTSAARAARGRPCRRAGRARPRRRPRSASAPVDARAQHDVPVERREQRVEHDRRRRRRVASAPHGRLQPPPSSARNARSARTARCAVASSIAASRSRVVARRRRGTRPPSAPCATCGSITVGVEHLGHLRPASPSRSSAATRRRPRRSPSSTRLRSRVSMLPRSGAEQRDRDEPRRAARAGAPSRCRRARRSGARRASRPTSASRGSPRSGTAASTRPGGVAGRQILGRVHREIGAAVEHGLLHFLDEHALCRRSRGGRSVWSRRRWSATSTYSTVARRAARRRARPASARACCHASRCGGDALVLGDGQVEQRRERVGVVVAARRAGRVLHAHGRLVQQLVDDALRQRLDQLALRRDRAARAWRGSARARCARTSSPSVAQRRDERRDLARGPSPR